MAKAAQPAPTGTRIHYERRRPEDTVLYQVVQEHLETFLAQVEGEAGSGLPEFVKSEFDAFLECGIPRPWLSTPALRRLRPREAPRFFVKRGFRPSRGAKLVFDIDMEHCPNCGGTLTILAAIVDPTVIAKILAHLGLPIRAPPRAPARHFALLHTA